MASWDASLWCPRHNHPTLLNTTRPGQAPEPRDVESWDASQEQGIATAKQWRGIEGEDGLFCPLFILSLTPPRSRLALPWDQHCPSPAEPCPGPTQNAHCRHLLPAAAENPRRPCSGRALPPSLALSTVSAGPLPAPRALSKHISQLEDKNIPFLTPRAIDFACSCGGGEGGRARGRER